MKSLYLLLLTGFSIYAQDITRRDSLQGGLTFERTCFDVQHYGLDIRINPENKYLSGYNDITFKVVATTRIIQLDLFENMKVDSIMYNGKRLDYKREYGAVFINFPESLTKGGTHSLRFWYSGYPVVAKNAPWDGGMVFSNDAKGKPWIGVAVQGTGASLWYPVKDSQSDEPDNGAIIKVAVPNGLMNVSNGRFIGSTHLTDGYTRWDWQVINPINNYNITVNIADYVHLHDSHNGLDLDYYVLRENEEKARQQFAEVKPMLDCFEAKFGKYPFAEDGYKLVETPYLGMEHQSAVAYGNKYQKGYRGGDLSGTGIGMLFDYIVVHESGHEWFGNSITSRDIADMWVHEAFTTYSESVYVECRWGYDKALEYINGQSRAIRNDRPVIGIFGVNKEGSGDMYFKGTLMLNTIRHIIDNDDKWWAMLLKFSKTYKKSIVTGDEVVQFFNRESGINLSPVFNQYLRYTTLPVLELRKKGKRLEYRWTTDEPEFKMPVDIYISGAKTRIVPTRYWQKAGPVKNLDAIKADTQKFLIRVNKR
ncbi:peptidase M1 [Nostoc linckia z15]|nr:peptidase M1 [Nostoc linckia z15]